MIEIKICLMSWFDYNAGIANWEWFTLPRDEYELTDWIESQEKQGKEDFFICDSYHDFISENTSIDALIALSNEDESDVTELSLYELPYGMECFNSVLDAYTPEQIADKVFNGHYVASHNYFRLNEVENIETMTNTEYEAYRDKVFSDGAKEYLANY